MTASAKDIPTDTPDPKTVLTENYPIEVISPYFSIENRTISDGTPLSGYIINGAPRPPVEYQSERYDSIKSIINATVL
jgi:hypothetical protein